MIIFHCAKSVRIQNYSGPHFSAFGLNTERYSVSLRYTISLGIQSKCGKIRTRITPNTSTFYAVFEESLYLEEDGLQLLEERYYNDYNWNVDDKIKPLKTPQKDCGKHFFSLLWSHDWAQHVVFCFFSLSSLVSSSASKRTTKPMFWRLFINMNRIQKQSPIGAPRTK